MSSRRQFLTTGLMAVGAWSLSQEVQAGRRRRRETSVVQDKTPSAPRQESEPTRKVQTGATPAANTEPKPVASTNRTSHRFIQPDSTRWLLLALEMTEREVLALLGEPLERMDHSEWYQL